MFGPHVLLWDAFPAVHLLSVCPPGNKRTIVSGTVLCQSVSITKNNLFPNVADCFDSIPDSFTLTTRSPVTGPGAVVCGHISRLGEGGRGGGGALPLWREVIPAFWGRYPQFPLTAPSFWVSKNTQFFFQEKYLACCSVFVAGYIAISCLIFSIFALHFWPPHWH